MSGMVQSNEGKWPCWAQAAIFSCHLGSIMVILISFGVHTPGQSEYFNEYSLINIVKILQTFMIYRLIFSI